jgi:hypothetical protein
LATVASSTKSFNGSGLGELGIAYSVKNGINFSLTKTSLNVLEKGPIYEINAEAIKTSPTITSISAYLSSIICPFSKTFRDVLVKEKFMPFLTE